MSKLISGKEAIEAFLNSESVEFMDKTGQWRTMLDNTILKVFIDHDKFRLKPRTITLNGVELPMPFKPKVGDIAYFLSEGYEDGYSFTDIFDTSPACFGYWKTEEEIKQVVAALRQVFGG